ncbi:PatB family C-S lyase [Alicyclobacillus cycloheptanicus]|uniref:cysteine-S-conjugate beta-lyase n=1 Tax=Alicyclobacillus cycloheptanicus TaxID=1457 RepID=A0ABT9XGB2_9BACL|nr:PatB family C-S lyase [Alicyclobacillus cycloheptanicus]MDQ0189340.1 cystathionine beta-lyase [Alicyclobacillus cycloheptanicus]WDM01304.1 PatB family C-S lyase [Alicyclobacillus cycloheptanicus]
MTYSFDQVISREHSASAKWDGRKGKFGTEDVLPMWVADMDFASPPSVIEALARRVQHGVFGYTIRDKGYDDAIVGWFARRHQWAVEPAWVSHAPGVVPALNYLIQALTETGDGIIIQTPVYHPFARLIRSHHRTLIESPLLEREGRYEMDFDDFEQKAAAGAKLFILCSPHNPVGRVWTRAELERVGEICVRHGVTVIADEIHCDLVYTPHRHIPFASISDEFAMHAVTTVAPSKTFNIAGLNMAVVIAKNPGLRDAYRQMLALQSAASIPALGLEALKAAYNGGDEWLDALLDYLQGNLQLLKERLAPYAPKVKVVEPEGTYLVWLDFRGLGLAREELDKFIVHDAKVGLEPGHIYGQEGAGFQRINIGCPRALLVEGLDRLTAALDRRSSDNT